jgi:hypothetical protein
VRPPSVIMEPITALTDAILAAWTATLCVVLFARAKILWACGFAAAALSSLGGAVYHAWRFPWKLVPVATGAAALCFGAAAAVAWLGPRARRIAIAILAVEFAACVVAASMTDSFLVVVADYLPVLVAILIGCIAHWRERAARLIALGIVVSFIAVGVQMSALPAHNDIYHVIQMAAMYLLYRGGFAAFA